MIVSVALLLYSAVFLSFIYRFVIYPVFISPLSKLPNAHPTSAILPTWLWYQVRSKNESRSILKAHRQYGPIVRLAPREVSVASMDGLRKIYSGRRFVRTPWMVLPFVNYGKGNLVTLTDINVHARRKKTMLQIYVKSAVIRSPDFQKLSAVILLERLLPSLESASKTSQGIDVYELLRAVAAEAGSAYETGVENCLDIVRPGREQARKEYFEHCKRKMMEIESHEESKKWLEEQLLILCSEADAQLKKAHSGDSNTKSESTSTSTHPVAYAHLAAAITAESSLLSTAEKLRTVASELLDNLEANREGSGFILTYATYELSRQPSLQRELRAELKTIEPSFPIGFGTSSRITAETLQSIDRLPLLESVVKETLRMYPPTPGPQRRDVPPGGVTVDGYYIPTGVTISTSQRALHMNEEVFPLADQWQPERWLQARGEKMDEDRNPAKWWWAFGSGARSCSGKDFATLGMSLIIEIVS
jgi:hypothetical protein